ncbi:MAG TPA: stage III sporulation protein AD [Firmicutes bacterium]|nr:stage III sporulation protein AD [Bacillota bacterium]
MEVIQVLGFALIATVLIMVLRQQRPEVAVLVSLAAATVILLFLADRIWQAITLLQDLARRAGVRDAYMLVLLKVMGMAYLAELGSQVCRDAGESAMASKVELAGKLAILILAIPVVTAVVNAILTAVPVSRP